jgi:hypothetical protein
MCIMGELDGINGVYAGRHNNVHFEVRGLFYVRFN